MTKIQFANGITVTIERGVVNSPTKELTALLDVMASRLPGYGSRAFEQDQDFNIARGIIERIGGGKIVA
jgi:hypothetical protein